MRIGWEEEREDKIRTKIKGQYHRRENAPKGKRAIEMTWYNEQPEPKASKTLFRNRLNGWYKKEEAILLWDSWTAVRKERQATHPQTAKTYVPKKIEQKQPDERDFLIEVTYPKEVAKVFRKEYQRMIEELEWELTYVSEKTEVAELNSKLERLYKEKEVFNSYNK